MRKILIVDDHEVLRDGVKQAFAKQPGTVTFGEASTVHEALRRVRDQDWDVVVLDLSLGDRSGLEVLKELKQICPRLPVLILSMHSRNNTHAERSRQGRQATSPKIPGVRSWSER